ncbi:MAG TPA: extensin family protein, partial [Methylomirabilota bacterium]|nr:extensin family protein [Methylomirabilota bacterium]
MLAAMPTRGLSRFLVPLLAVSLAGCGLFDDDDRAPWRAQAEATCFARGMVKLTSLIAETKEVDGKGACGLDRPLKVTALADGSVRIGDKAVTMSCPMTAALETWVRDVVQPAAWRHYGAPVV